MIDALVVCLREGIEAALVVGVALAYLDKVGRGDLRRFVYEGLAAAVAASVLGAWLFQAFGVNAENEILEGALFLVAAVFVGSMVVWMWRTGRRLTGRMEGRIGSLVRGADGSARTQAWGIRAFAFVMVFREGMETVLFLTALSRAIGSNPLLVLTGSSVGLGLAIVFGTLVIRGSVRIDLAKFFTATSAILLILVAKLLANALHEFAEVGLVPLNRVAMYVVGLLVRESSSLVILIAMILIPFALLVAELLRSRAPAVEEKGPERRKQLAARRQEIGWKTAAASSSLLLAIAFSALAIALARGTYDPSASDVEAVGGVVELPIADLAGEDLHKFVWRAEGGGEVRFLVLEIENGEYRTAIDACSLCPPVGYVSRGKEIRCKSCSAPVPGRSIGLSGGCNPIPLPHVRRDGKIVISVQDLARHEQAFRG